VEVDAMGEVSVPAQEMYDFVRDLFPVCRSLTGDGVRQTLNAIRRQLPDLSIHEVPSGTPVFDWTVPDEWNIRAARLVGPRGDTIADFADNNLHVVGYSEPVDVTLTLEELQEHLYSLPDLPDAIPYVTSYYKRAWGFCLPDRVRGELPDGSYRAVIDSTLAPGSLTYGELRLKGSTNEEIFLSTYVCHPSMANNELSGPAVTTWLAKWLTSHPRRYGYRVVFIPETIGSLTYMSKNLEEMKANIVAGFNLTCVGDDRCFSYLPSRLGHTLADRAATHVLSHLAPDYVHYSFLDRGSDERQYCAPGIDLPVCSVMRSKYGEYPEYHTSLDNLELVTARGLGGSYEAYRRVLECLEANDTLESTTLGEPQLGRRGLYPTTSTKGSGLRVRNMMNLLAYGDGEHDLLRVAEIVGIPMWELLETVETLKGHGVLVRSADRRSAASAQPSQTRKDVVGE
jgi:aminopeptidase-like protein